MGEFDLIEAFFKRPTRQAARDSLVALGIGDDCALLQPRAGTQIALSCDMLVEGRHFFADVDAQALGHKALAVNLSDLAACGAKPLAFTLALALPRVDEAWLAGFATGLFALADEHGCELVGGDTTCGPLNICITVLGEVPLADGRTSALLRSGARPGDDIYVSGRLGEARMALAAMRGQIQLPPDVLAAARARLERPTPRVALGQALRGIASAAIDVSDGLLGDLGHVLKASKLGATVHTDLALNGLGTPALRALPQAMAFVMAGGDDYELAFTAPPSARAAVQAVAQSTQTPVTRIGQVDAAKGLRLLDAQGAAVADDFHSFDHFSEG
jgi:thiamine-monophosphate kinase